MQSTGYDNSGRHTSITKPGNLGTRKVLDFAYETSDGTRPRTVVETPTGGTGVMHVFTRTALGVTETVDNGTRSSHTGDTEGLLVGLKDKAGARYGSSIISPYVSPVGGYHRGHRARRQRS